MVGFKKSSLHGLGRHTSAEPGVPSSSHNNPFDSDIDSDKKTLVPSTRTSSGDEGIESAPSSSQSLTWATKKNYKNGFRDSGGLENQTVEELESYAVYKAEETTEAFNNILKIGLDIREDATKTLVTLHQQGEQINMTHTKAANIEHDLSRGEKLLGSLGGMFSKTWKPKKTHSITGPKGSHLGEKKHRSGLVMSPPSDVQSRPPRQPLSEATNSLQKVEIEKTKQDDALDDLSNILGELKDMAIDMGLEMERQNKALDHFHVDVEELNFRVKGANQRGRHLLGK